MLRIESAESQETVTAGEPIRVVLGEQRSPMTRMSSVREREPACPAVGKVTTRSAVAADSSFLLELYASAWQGELDPIGWSISGQRTFVIMQAQTREWRLIRRFQQLSRLTVCVDDEPVGRMLVSCTDAVIDSSTCVSCRHGVVAASGRGC